MAASGCKKDDPTRLHHLYFSEFNNSLAPGEEFQMELKMYPEESTAGLPSEPITWSSSDTTVATVSQTGLVSGIKFGQTDIVVTWGPFKLKERLYVTRVADIEDETFLNFILQRFDDNDNGKLDGKEVFSLIGLDLTEMKVAHETPVSLKGIDNFVNLQSLRMDKLKVTDMDLSRNTELRSLDMDDCEIDTIDLRFNAKITNVRCFSCPTLKAIIFGSMEEFGRNELTILHCENDDIENLDLSRAGRTLAEVRCNGNQRLTSLDLTADTTLITLKYSCETTNVALPEPFVPYDIIITCVDDDSNTDSNTDTEPDNTSEPAEPDDADDNKDDNDTEP